MIKGDSVEITTVVMEKNEIVHCPKATDNQVSCGLNEYRFTERIVDTVVSFQCLQLRDSFIIWIGSQQVGMNSLAIAIPTKFVRFIYVVLIN